MSDDGDLHFTAFHVDDSLEDYELDLPPASGMEYLRRVRLEARQCPNVVVADMDVGNFNKQQTVKLSGTNGCQPPPNGFAPSVQWQRKQVADFSEVRQRLTRYKAKEKKEIISLKKEALPDSEDAETWCKLCFGRYRANESPSKVSTDSIDSNQGTAPLLSIVTAMDQPTVVRVLEYHINWFEATGFSQEQGRWFYSLLSCLEKPLIPEACSLLRSLVRNCANLRATLHSAEDPILPALNLFICLVSRYFDQMDLADDT